MEKSCLHFSIKSINYLCIDLKVGDHKIRGKWDNTIGAFGLGWADYRVKSDISASEFVEHEQNISCNSISSKISQIEIKGWSWPKAIIHICSNDEVMNNLLYQLDLWEDIFVIAKKIFCWFLKKRWIEVKTCFNNWFYTEMFF